MSQSTAQQPKKSWYDDWLVERNGNGNVHVSLPHAQGLAGHVRFRKISDARVIWLIGVLDCALTELTSQKSSLLKEVREKVEGKRRKISQVKKETGLIPRLSVIVFTTECQIIEDILELLKNMEEEE